MQLNKNRNNFDLTSLDVAKYMDTYKKDFLTLLHSKDSEINFYSLSYEIILANIVIALTGIGIFLIAIRLIYTLITENQALFFFQTKNMQLLDLVSELENFFSPSAPQKTVSVEDNSHVFSP